LALGTDTDSDEAKAHIDSKYLDHFRLLGKRSDVESLVNAMDICVLSTFTEGISNSILEYMALGKPVIASYGGGTNEIIEDGKTGFLVKPSDTDELVMKIETVLNDPAVRNSFGLAGKERIKTIFSINNMINQ
jgi:glycosyltransferase involved in cell wall biosynthesis